MPVHKNDADLIKELYEDIDFNLQNRRMVPVGIEGVAVIYDDAKREEGLAVVRVDKVDLLVKVTHKDGKTVNENGDVVVIKGWVHSVLKPKLSSVSSEFIPPQNDKTSL